MVNWSSETLREHEQRQHQRRLERLRAAQPELDPGLPLDPPATGEAQSLEGVSGGRFRITFTIYRVQPVDWDNSFIKPLQDILVLEEFLPSDAWDRLEGTVRSRKCQHRHEQRTEVTIERL